MLAFASPTPDATPVWLVSAENWPSVKSTIGAAAAAFAERCGFQPKAGRMQLLPGEAGALAGVLFGVDEANAPTRDPFGPGKLATSLPEGVYRFANAPQDADLAALGFLLALYRYDRFKADKAPKPRSSRPTRSTRSGFSASRRRSRYGRDLVNTPANVLGPDALEQEAVKLAEHFDASVTMVRGDELIGRQFSAHPCGRPRGAPRRRGSSTSPGARGRAESGACRQGRHLRHRRPRHQAGVRHGAHEEGHGRRGDGADAGADGHGGGA